MDFLHRSANNQPQRGNGGGQGPSAAAAANVERIKKMVEDADQPRWIRVTFVALLFSVTILLVAIAFLFYTGRPHEAQFVDEDKNQAVFLTNGQVYFGKVKDVTSQYLNLTNIYYLNSQSADSNDTSKATSFSLVKLGCELHGPADQMVINRDQVSFWENLKTDGKVAKAIEQWKTENPNGQKCTDTTNSTQQSPTGTTTGTTNEESSNQ